MSVQLGAEAARINPEFDRRGVKAIGLSVDLIDSLQLTANHKVAAAVNWQETPLPYMRVVPQPEGSER